MTLVGSGFSSYSDWNAGAVFKGVAIAEGTVDSDTEVTVTFTNGVPVTTADNDVSLRFENPVNGQVQYAYKESLVEVPTDTLVISDSTAGLVCSFQGGCSYTVTATGLTSVLLPHDTDAHTNRIEVCG